MGGDVRARVPWATLRRCARAPMVVRVARLDTLHVAAMPYPTSQGTQAAIGLMLDALARAGRRTALLTYPSGSGREDRFEHLVRRGMVRPRSLRSGPSLEKLAADVELAIALRGYARGADVVIAHHVEAASIAHALGLPRWVFVAHTTLGPELPTYLPRALAPIASKAGRTLDRWLASVAPALAAISPHVATSLLEVADREAVVLPVPMDPITATVSRTEARAALGVAQGDEVVLYAGNLDAYQGLPVLVDALTELRASRPRARILVASQSDTRELRGYLERRGHRAYFAPLGAEVDRARAHAAADVAVVTRGTSGGFPIKLLDAVARDVPVVAMRRAMSGSELAGVCVCDDDAVSLARGLRGALTDAHASRDARALARAALVQHHCPDAFVQALDRAIERTSAPSKRATQT